MSAVTRYLDQCKNPKGWLGKFVLWTMNRRHSRVTDWGLKHVSVGAQDTILDIGCGGGRTLAKLAAIATEGKVYGVDHSPTGVALARRSNKRLIETGHAEIQQGSVSQLPFPDDMFDVITAVETHFFWPDLPLDMREVLRVLKPSGTFAIIAEMYGGGKYDGLARKLGEITNMTLLSKDGHRDLFTNAGFCEVRVADDYDKGWICALGRKAS